MFSRACDRKLTFSLVGAKKLFGGPQISCEDAVDWLQSGYWPISSVWRLVRCPECRPPTPVLALDRLFISLSVNCIVDSSTSNFFFGKMLHYFWFFHLWNQIFDYFVKSLSLSFFERIKFFLFSIIMKHK